MLKQKHIREAVEECKYFLRRVKMYNEEVALKGKAIQEHVVGASAALSSALRRIRSDLDRTPKDKESKTPTLLELARSDVRKVFVTKEDRAELKNGGIYVRFDRLTSNKDFMDIGEAAEFLDKNYHGLGISVGDSPCDVIGKLYLGRARPRKSEEDAPF